jgi:uncharacterized RDD family membrane protein YckC
MLEKLDTTAMIGIFVVPAVLFALVYSTIVTKLSRGLLSPYAKANVRRRLCAAAIDSLIVVTACLLSSTSRAVLYLAAGAGYLLFRDAIRGQSVGKLLFGLVVISLETHRPSSLADSVRRNLLLLLPGANVVAIFLEARTVLHDGQGQRLGDKLAQTQVVEGLGARELVKSFQDWLMGFGGEFTRAAGGRGRAPVRQDRAA